MKREEFNGQAAPERAVAMHEEKILRRRFHGYRGGLAARLPSAATDKTRSLRVTRNGANNNRFARLEPTYI